MTHIIGNQTKENETLYYFEDLSLLFIVGQDRKVKHTICGSVAPYMYKKLAACAEKKMRIDKMTDLEKKIFYSNISGYTDKVIQTMANYEMCFLSAK